MLRNYKSSRILPIKLNECCFRTFPPRKVLLRQKGARVFNAWPSPLHDSLTSSIICWERNDSWQLRREPIFWRQRTRKTGRQSREDWQPPPPWRLPSHHITPSITSLDWKRRENVTASFGARLSEGIGWQRKPKGQRNGAQLLHRPEILRKKTLSLENSEIVRGLQSASELIFAPIFYPASADVSRGSSCWNS